MPTYKLEGLLLLLLVKRVGNDAGVSKRESGDQPLN